MIGRQFFRIFVVAAAIFLADTAEAFVQDGSCAVIVASRKSMAEVDAFVRANPQISFGPVFSSRNGWYAISAGTVEKDAADEHLSRLKARGIIPPDSYCSEGESYTAIARTPASAAADAEKSVQYGLYGEFDAHPMVVEEKRFLQAALALQGYYKGLLDGVWGRGSQEAIERYSWAEFGSEPLNVHAAAAMLIAGAEFSDGAWEPVSYPEFGVSLYLPTARITVKEQNEGFLHLQDTAQAIDILIGIEGYDGMRSVHDQLIREHDDPNEPYALRKADFWVTSVTRGNLRDYAWSRFDDRRGGWVTIWIDSIEASVGPGLMVSSITEGRGAWLELPEDGHSARHVRQVATILAEEGAEPQPREPSYSVARPEPNEGLRPASGSGFFINSEGAILTNAHVVEGCGSLTADGQPAELLVESGMFDLAVIRQTSGHSSGMWLPFAESPAGLNADITVAGYPLHGLLGGLNVTRGSISSLKGIGGDEMTLQISAPVQPGNSGGPMVNRKGQVVGIVVAKLDAMQVAEITGDVPQNINFAIRAEGAKMLLAANSIGFEIKEDVDAVELGPEELASRLQDATVLIECN